LPKKVSLHHYCARCVGLLRRLTFISFSIAASLWNFGCRYATSLHYFLGHFQLHLFGGDWRLSNIPHNKVNQWDCFVTAIIWVVWNKRTRRIFQTKSSSIMVLCRSNFFHLWWLFGGPTSRSTGVERRVSLLLLRQFL